MPTTYGNDIVYCLKSHCGVRGYCRQKWVLQVQIICKFSNERTCKRNKDVQGLSCGFEDNLFLFNFLAIYPTIRRRCAATEYHFVVSEPSGFHPGISKVRQEYLSCGRH